MKTKSNTTLELIKLFASYMVVFLHVLFSGKTAVVVDALARFAVPFFFLVSGFYSYKITAKKIAKRTLRILLLLILAEACYTAMIIAPFISEGRMDIVGFHLEKYVDPDILSELLIFNVPISSAHLWYLFAMVYVYVIFFFATVLRVNEKVIFTVSLLLLILHLLLGECFTALGMTVRIPVLRNFALMGIPFFGLGLLAKKYESKLRGIPGYVLAICAVIGIGESLLSRYFLGKNELYIGSVLILFAACGVFVKYSGVQYPRFFTAFEDCSTYVYIFHLIISSWIIKLYGQMGIDKDSSVLLKNLHPIIVCVASTIFALCITQVVKKTQRKNKIQCKKTAE